MLTVDITFFCNNSGWKTLRGCWVSYFLHRNISCALNFLLSFSWLSFIALWLTQKPGPFSWPLNLFATLGYWLRSDAWLGACVKQRQQHRSTVSVMVPWNYFEDHMIWSCNLFLGLVTIWTFKKAARNPEGGLAGFKHSCGR